MTQTPTRSRPATSDDKAPDAASHRKAIPAFAGRAGLGLARYGIVLSFAALFTVLSILSHPFLSRVNLLNVLDANAAVAMTACAGTLVVIAGDLDISVGGIFALSGVVAAKVTILSSSVGLGILAGCATGAAAGLFNGLIVAVGRVNSFVATLATGIMFQSVALVLAAGNTLAPVQSSYTTLGRGTLLGVTYGIWLALLVVLLTGFLLSRARFGRQTLIVGCNPVAARLSGIPVSAVRCLALTLSGAAAGLADVIVTSRSAQTDANVGGTTFVLAVIAAIAVGGTSLRGGQGAIWRTVLGVLFLGLVANGLNLLNVEPTYQQVVTGVLILLAVTVDSLGRRTAGTT
ncbi:MAG: ABC transporter permease [Pseudonocardiales bacterium]|nr:MAG: ABC transporter permease [Pseudonocardiales bacterium]